MSELRSRPFAISVDDATLVDLRARIHATRWPDPAPGEPWSQGTDRAYLESLLACWAGSFDWRARERELNRFNHRQAEVDGVRLHFIHERARRGTGIPLVLTHGWPSCFLELLPLVPLLTDPARHGITGPAFDLVIPSLPGYGFSERPPRTGVSSRVVAGLWHRLMRGLGYSHYGAGGGDFGAAVASYMALDDPDAIIGLHLTNLDLAPFTGPGARALSERERAYLTWNQSWAERERGYALIQGTKPQTVGYGLNDSPAGLAAWLLEKWRSWTDSGGDLDLRFGREFLLSLLTIYWATGTITSSMRDYYDNRWCREPIGPGEFVRVPTGVAVFPNEFVPEGLAPREWAERLYNVRRWTVFPRGGHFAPVEQPQLVAADIATFFSDP